MIPKSWSSTDSNEIRTMHTKNDYIEIKINEDADEIIQELFDSLLCRY